MAFPTRWLEAPPDFDVDKNLSKNQLSQFAGYVRDMAIEGSASQILLGWLYKYEQKFTPPAQRIMEPPQEELFDPPKNASNINQGVAEILREVKGVLGEIGTAVKNLSGMSSGALEKIDLAYAGSLDKLTEGIDKLSSGQEKLSGAYAQLTDDHRSFLGLIFPHVSDMYRTTNESIAAYRQGLIAQSAAEVKAATAAAGGGASGDGGMDAEVGKALAEMLADAARAKMGLPPKSAAASAAIQETKATPKQEPPPQEEKT